MSKPQPEQNIDRATIKAAYALGEAAVIELVEGMSEQYVSLIEKLIAQQAVLEARIKALEDKQKKTSRNSSKPPSGDGFGKRTKSLRKKSERLSGGQKGHPGNTLEWRAQVDEEVTHQVHECQHCHASLLSAPVTDYERRQVHELPPLRLQVIEHAVEIKRCAGCEHLSRGCFPAGVNTRIQYGSRIKGLMVYLLDAQLLPSDRTRELLHDLFECEVSEGTLYNARAKCFEQLTAVEQQIKADLVTSEVVHFDETGFRVNSKLWWLHVASTAQLTYYFIDRKRGRAAIDQMDILPNFDGVSVHDGWASYFGYDCAHALCNAHHLRELRFIVERYEQPWAQQMMTLLCDIKAAVDTAKANQQKAMSTAQLHDFEEQYQTLLMEGFRANRPPPVDPDLPKKKGRKKQSPPKNLLDRLERHDTAVLAFMLDFRVPFDNNQAERDVRMMKLKQKISGCFRSELGSQQFCRIRGYLSTLRKQGQPLLKALSSTFMGNPFYPMTSA
ncbi:MAG: IS66 family transposase [Cyanobacteria bacterium P01_A01_bin.116]